jgi:hypothetical protein
MRSIAIVILVASLACARRERVTPVQTPASDQRDAGVVDGAMSGGPVSDAHRLHLEWTPVRAPSAGDSARAARLAEEARSAVARYRDVRVAEAEGFRAFAPNVEQKVLHYTNWQYAIREHFRFDVTKPTSLLYTKRKNGSLELTGVMYATGKRASLAQLDARVPLSIARWHRHVNLCLPNRTDRWTETRDGKPLFGPESPIATRAECEKVGGHFSPNLFGWMVHANVFASNPADVWRDEHAPASHGAHSHGH